MKILFLVLLLAGLAVHSNCLHQFDVFRMYQLERGGTLFGSHKLSFTSEGAVASELHSTSDLSRKIVLLLQEECVENTVELLSNRSVGGVLLLLSNEEESQSSSWRAFENKILSTKFVFPFYFAHKDGVLERIYSDLLHSNTALLNSPSDAYKFSVAGAEPSLLPQLDLVNFQGTLAGAPKPGAEPKALPSVLIVAHYDSFSAAPGLKTGADSSASGTVALLELARLFSKLYRGHRTQPPYDIHFLLTSGGKLNYAGSAEWLKNQESSRLSSVELVLCLEALATSTPDAPLYLHLTSLPKEPKLIKLLDDFNTTAKSEGIQFQVIRKKVNLGSVDSGWEHHLYVKKRLSAYTLSHFNTTETTPLVSRSSLLDTRDRINVTLLERNIKFVAQSLGKFLFDVHGEGVELFERSLSLSPLFIQSQLDAVTSISRSSHLLAANSPLLSHLEALFTDYTSKVQRQTFKADSEFQFYGVPKAAMSCFKVKSIWFDVFFTLQIGIYLLGLHLSLKGFQSIEAFKEYVVLKSKTFFKQ